MVDVSTLQVVRKRNWRAIGLGRRMSDHTGAVERVKGRTMKVADSAPATGTLLRFDKVASEALVAAAASICCCEPHVSRE